VTEVSTIGLDLAKMVFQVHGADASGAFAFRKTLRRAKVLEFFRDLPRCVVAMEACGGAHHWAREIGRLGHEVRLIPPIYVKPFVKRQKNDASDAEAICEAAQRPTMRFVAVKSESAQPVQRSTGGKQKLGATSKMGERTIRRLLIIGAAALVRQTSRREPPPGSWLARMLARKPRMLVITALANKWRELFGRCSRTTKFTELPL
jgi:transposase